MKKVKAKEFDAEFDRGEDVTKYRNYSLPSTGYGNLCPEGTQHTSPGCNPGCSSTHVSPVRAAHLTPTLVNPKGISHHSQFCIC